MRSPLDPISGFCYRSSQSLKGSIVAVQLHAVQLHAPSNPVLFMQIAVSISWGVHFLGVLMIRALLFLSRLS